MSSVGNVSFTVDYYICQGDANDYNGGTMSLEIADENNIVTYESRTIDGSWSAPSGTQTFTHNFARTGQYTIWAQATKKTHSSGGSYGDMRSSQSTIKVSGNPRLIVWSGKSVKLNTNEAIGGIGAEGQYYYGYAMAIQALDGANVPQNGVTITLSSSDPSVIINPSSTATTTLRTVSGIVSPFISFIGTIGNEVRNVNINETATINSTNVSLTIPIIYENDKEGSGLSGYHHEQDGNSNEILGDNYADYLETGSAKTQKNVKVQLDYSSDFAKISDLDNIITEVQNIWNAWGVYMTITKGTAISTSNVPGSLTRDDAETLLSSVSKPSDNIHVVIAKGADLTLSGDGTYGITIHYGQNGENYSFVDCANLATGDPSFRSGNHGASYYLSRTGCIIFSSTIEIDLSSIYALYNWTSTQVYAWVIAHELGHAMGISQHPDEPQDGPSLMTPPSFDDTYYAWTKLLQKSLNLLNTRDRLGVETVDIGNTQVQTQ